MQTTNTYFLAGSVVVAGLLIAGAVYWNGQHPAAGGGTAGTGTPSAVNIADVKTAGNPYIGNANAPVTVAFWSDFQCPFCKEFETTTLPQIIQDYVNAGKVKVVFLDFPFLGPDSMVDAEYARAIWQLYPDKYFAWRSDLFKNQPKENSLSASQNLTFLNQTMSSVSGIDAAKVKAAVAANQSTYDTAINADKTQGQSMGVNATPSFIIGKQLIAGAYPYATFKTALDAQLQGN